MEKKVIVFISLLLYKVLYEYIYAKAVSPLFSYMGLPFIPNYHKCAISYLLFAIVIVVLLKNKECISKCLLSVFLIFTITPMLSFYWQANESTRYILYCTISFLLLVVVVYSPIKVVNTHNIIVSREYVYKMNIPLFLSFIIASMMILITIKYGLANTKALNLYNIYEVRQSRSFSGIYGYMINWIPYALVPCLLCISLYKKKWGYVVFALCTQIYIYLLVGSKTALFSIGLILISYFLANKKDFYLVGWCSIVSLISIGAWGVWRFIGELMPFGIFPVRLLSVPASISFEHYNFFSTNPKLHFSENIIGKVLGIQSPYDEISTYLVAEGGSNHCTGYLGDAYDNGGFFIMILYSLVFAVILRFVDNLYKKAKKTEDKISMYVGILTYSIIYLNDGTLTAVLVTGGLIIILLILKIQEDKDYKNSSLHH